MSTIFGDSKTPQRFSMICYNTVYLSQKTPALVTLIFNLRAWIWWYSNRQHYCQKHLVVKGVNTPQISIFAHTVEIKKLNNPLTHIYGYKSWLGLPVTLHSLTAFWNTIRSKLKKICHHAQHGMMAYMRVINKSNIEGDWPIYQFS